MSYLTTKTWMDDVDDLIQKVRERVPPTPDGCTECRVASFEEAAGLHGRTVYVAHEAGWCVARGGGYIRFCAVHGHIPFSRYWPDYTPDHPMARFYGAVAEERDRLVKENAELRRGLVPVVVEETEFHLDAFRVLVPNKPQTVIVGMPSTLGFERLWLVAKNVSGPGVLLESLKLNGEELLPFKHISLELYKEDMGADFDPTLTDVPPGAEIAITLANGSDKPITVDVELRDYAKKRT